MSKIVTATDTDHFWCTQCRCMSKFGEQWLRHDGDAEPYQHKRCQDAFDAAEAHFGRFTVGTLTEVIVLRPDVNIWLKENAPRVHGKVIEGYGLSGKAVA